MGLDRKVRHFRRFSTHVDRKPGENITHIIHAVLEQRRIVADRSAAAQNPAAQA